MITECEICKRQYAKNNASPVCSKKCRLLRQKQLREQKLGSRVCKCDICGNEFIRRKKAMVCSDVCRLERKKRIHSEYHKKKWKDVQAAKTTQKNCAQCGSAFWTCYVAEVCCSATCKQVRMRHQQLDCMKHKSSELTDDYIAKCVRMQGLTVTDELIEVTRIRIQIKRELRDYQKYPNLKPRPKKQEPKEVKCACCSCSFHTTIPNKMFCSKRCYQIVRNQRRKHERH